MHRTEAEFCRDQAERLLLLARGCDDFVLREQLTNVASDWVARARAVKAPPKAAYGSATKRGGVS